MLRDVTALTGVYQANGSLSGELRYVVGKLLGSAHCALCDITHGAVREKPGFVACREALHGGQHPLCRRAYGGWLGALARHGRAQRL